LNKKVYIDPYHSARWGPPLQSGGSLLRNC